MDTINLEKESLNEKTALIKRLRRIEGQVKGIQKMIEAEKNCNDILTQVAAVRAAINKVGGMVLERHSKICVQKALISDDKQKSLEDLIETVQKFLKFVD